MFSLKTKNLVASFRNFSHPRPRPFSLQTSNAAGPRSRRFRWLVRRSSLLLQTLNHGSGAAVLLAVTARRSILEGVTTQGDGNIEKYRGEEPAWRPLGPNFKKAMLTRQHDKRTGGLQITRAASSFFVPPPLGSTADDSTLLLNNSKAEGELRCSHAEERSPPASQISDFN
jgi:hypothetical protein